MVRFIIFKLFLIQDFNLYVFFRSKLDILKACRLAQELIFSIIIYEGFYGKRYITVCLFFVRKLKDGWGESIESLGRIQNSSANYSERIRQRLFLGKVSILYGIFVPRGSFAAFLYSRCSFFLD